MEQELNKIEAYQKRIFEAQRIAVIQEAKEDLTEEQIEARCSELRNQTINAESMNNRFRNPKLHSIWNSPPRFKRNSNTH